MNRQARIDGKTIARMALGLTWIAGAIYNLVWTLWHPELLGDEGFGANASLPVYRWFFGDVVGGAPAFWTVLLILGELGLGALTLARGVWAKAGLWGSVAWSLWLFPLMWPYTQMMGPFALLPAWLLRDEPRWSVLDVIGHLAHRPALTHHRHA